MSCPFSRVPYSTVDKEWTEPITAERRQAMAAQLNIKPEDLVHYVAIEMPDTDMAKQYMAWWHSMPERENNLYLPPMLVSCQAFREAHGHEGTKRWFEEFAATGQARSFVTLYGRK